MSHGHQKPAHAPLPLANFRALPDRQLLERTYELVFAVNERWPDVTEKMLNLFARVEASEKRTASILERIERIEARLDERSNPRGKLPSSDPPPSRFNKTDTGRHVIVEEHGQRHVIPVWAVQAVVKQMNTEEAASNWQGLIKFTKWTGRNVFLALLIALTLLVVGTAIGHQLH